MGSAKEIATVPSVAHLGGVGVVNLAHRIHRSHVSQSDGTGKQCDPPDLWEDIGCSVGLDSPQHLFHLNISQPFAAGMPLVYGDLTRAPTGTLDHDPAINCDRLGTCVLKRMVHWMAQEVNASSLAVSHARSGWNHNAGGSRGTAQNAPKNKHKQTTLSRQRKQSSRIRHLTGCDDLRIAMHD